MKVAGGENTGEKEFESWTSYEAYARDIRRRRRYLWSREVRDFLTAVRRTAKEREFPIQRGMSFYRAQVGWEQDVVFREDGTSDGPLAFGAERMKPDARLIPDGRANAAGIPVLYLALDPETAIAEVRPWIGTRVSVSRFKTTKELRALDLSREYGKTWWPGFSAKEKKFLPVDSAGKKKSIWTQIDNAFSRPVPFIENTAEYVPTQVLAELFRDEGYDAITYRSSLRKKGFNVVIFDPSLAEPVDGTPYEVTRVRVKAKPSGYSWTRKSEQDE